MSTSETLFLLPVLTVSERLSRFRSTFGQVVTTSLTHLDLVPLILFLLGWILALLVLFVLSSRRPRSSLLPQICTILLCIIQIAAFSVRLHSAVWSDSYRSEMMTAQVILSILPPILNTATLVLFYNRFVPASDDTTGLLGRIVKKASKWTILIMLISSVLETGSILFFSPALEEGGAVVTLNEMMLFNVLGDVELLSAVLLLCICLAVLWAKGGNGKQLAILSVAAGLLLWRASFRMAQILIFKTEEGWMNSTITFYILMALPDLMVALLFILPDWREPEDILPISHPIPITDSVLVPDAALHHNDHTWPPLHIQKDPPAPVDIKFRLTRIQDGETSPSSCAYSFASCDDKDTHHYRYF